MLNEPDETCLYVALRSPRERHDQLLRELVAPIVREIRAHPDLDSLFFVRYAEPAWELRFRVLGRPAWVEGPVRARVLGALDAFVAAGAIEGVEQGRYDREWERYGGPAGMRLAEQIFLHDSLACLELLEAESAGTLGRSRREYALAFTEDLLGLFGFDRERRLELYREGHAWAYRDGVFKDEDGERLERQYAKARDGLHEALFGESARDPVRRYGGAVPAGIAARALEATRPCADAVVAGCAAGTIRQDLVSLVWSYTHMHCNRLGIEVVAEAILRYLAFRAYEESLGA